MALVVAAVLGSSSSRSSNNSSLFLKPDGWLKVVAAYSVDANCFPKDSKPFCDE